jgi:hypothetical protein
MGKSQNPHLGIIEARKRMNWESWGDVILFQINIIDQEWTNIQVSSRPVYPLQIVDYGSNFDNVEKICSFLMWQANQLRFDQETFIPDRMRPGKEY